MDNGVSHVTAPVVAPQASPVAATSSAVRWRYALLNLGLVIPAQLSSFLLLYYVDHLRLDPVKFAALTTAFAVYNAVDNPVIGHLSDRTRGRWGRRLPYLWLATLPAMLGLALMFNAPFTGEQPRALLLYFAATWLLWETASTMLGTAYLGLLPEMFRSFAERSDVAVRMNAVQVVGLLLGLALPPLLAARLGWGAVGAGLAVLCAALVYGNLRPLFERPQASAAPSLPLLALLRLTFTNRSFLTVVAAQTMRFLATGVLASGMGFYVKYSLGEPGGAVTSLLLATAFVTAGLCLWPWHRFVARPYGARTTLLAAFAVSGLAVLPLLWVNSVAGAVLTIVLFGAGLSGMILMGDVIMADVIDEAELRTGQRQEGAYYGLSGLIITLSGGVTAALFGWVSHRYGYDPSLGTQPATVAQGFRLFMGVPPLVGAALAFALLWFYPLHGERLRVMRERLAERRAGTDRRM